MLKVPKFSDYTNDSSRLNDVNRLQSITRKKYNISETDNNKLYFLPGSFTIAPFTFKSRNNIHPITIVGTLRNNEKAVLHIFDEYMYFVDIIIGKDNDETPFLLKINEIFISHNYNNYIIKKIEDGTYINNGFYGQCNKWLRIYFTSMKDRRLYLDVFDKIPNLKDRIASNMMSYSYKDDLIMFISKNNINTAQWMCVENYILQQDKKTTIKHEYSVFSLADVTNVDINDYTALELNNVGVSIVYDIECYAGNKNNDFPAPENKDDLISMISMTVSDERGKDENKITLILAPMFIPSDDTNIFAFMSEIEMLKAFFYIINNIKPEWIVDFNGFSFDQRWILKRAVIEYKLNKYINRAFSIWSSDYISPFYLARGGNNMDKDITTIIKMDAKDNQECYLLKPEYTATMIDVFVYLYKLTKTLDLPGRKLDDYLEYYNIPLKDKMKFTYMNLIFTGVLAMTAIIKRENMHYSDSTDDKIYPASNLSYHADLVFPQEKYRNIKDIIKYFLLERKKYIDKETIISENINNDVFLNLVKSLTAEYHNGGDDIRSFYNGVIAENNVIINYNVKDTTSLCKLCHKVNIFDTHRIRSSQNHSQICNFALRGENSQAISLFNYYMEVYNITSRTLNNLEESIKRSIHNDVKKRGGKTLPPMHPKNGIIQIPVLCVDVISFYPSIQQQLDISTDTMISGKLNSDDILFSKYDTLQIRSASKRNMLSENKFYHTTFVRTKKSLCGLIQKKNKEDRAKIKLKMAELKKAGDTGVSYLVLDALQNAKKIQSNSIFGINGCEFMCKQGEISIFVNNAITTTAGYLLLSCAKYIFARFGACFAGGDTDSIFMILDKSVYEKCFYQKTKINYSYDYIYENFHDDLIICGEILCKLIKQEINTFLFNLLNGGSIEMEIDEIPAGMPMLVFEKKMYVLQGRKKIKKQIEDINTDELKIVETYERKIRGIATRRKGKTYIEKLFINRAIENLMVFDINIDVKEVIYNLIKEIYNMDIDISHVKQSVSYRPNKDNKMVISFVNRMKMMHDSDIENNIYIIPIPNERFEVAATEQGSKRITLNMNSKQIQKGDKIEYIHVIKHFNLAIDKNHYILDVICKAAAQFLKYMHYYVDNNIVDRAIIIRNISKDITAELNINLETPKLSSQEKKMLLGALTSGVIDKIQNEDFIDLKLILLRKEFPIKQDILVLHSIYDLNFAPNFFYETDLYINLKNKTTDELHELLDSSTATSARTIYKEFINLLAQMHYTIEYILNYLLHVNNWNVVKTVNYINVISDDKKFIKLKNKIQTELDKPEVIAGLKNIYILKQIIKSRLK